MATKEVVDYQLTTVDLSADVRRRAVIAVAAAAEDPDECVQLLGMLGLTAEEALPGVPKPRG
jgi:hypothetical protein